MKNGAAAQLFWSVSPNKDGTGGRCEVGNAIIQSVIIDVGLAIIRFRTVYVHRTVPLVDTVTLARVRLSVRLSGNNPVLLVLHYHLQYSPWHQGVSAGFFYNLPFLCIVRYIRYTFSTRGQNEVKAVLAEP